MTMTMKPRAPRATSRSWIPLAGIVCAAWMSAAPAADSVTTTDRADRPERTREETDRLDAACTRCHAGVEDPHTKRVIAIACIDCHGGKDVPDAPRPAARAAGEEGRCPASPDRKEDDVFRSSANPERSYTHLLREKWDVVRFINPGDLRVAHATCAGSRCHSQTVLAVRKSLMTNAAHFWGTASYSNGIVPLKKTIFGETYGPDGTPQKAKTVWRDPSKKADELAKHGVVEAIVPLPHWEVIQPGNVYRVFERGSRLGTAALGLNGSNTPVIGLPDKIEDPGRPNNRLSDRGLGTLNRVDLPLLNVHKTRLNDPFLSFMGTNDSPGDYRSSGCTACHVPYANDRSPVHSGPFAVFGNTGKTASPDPMIPKDESGHPIAHKFTIGMPSSQCLVCHMHQPNSFVNTYYGFQMWSYETDGELFWPKEQVHPGNAEYVGRLMRNPEEAAVRGLWGDPEFLRNVTDLNPRAKHTQFADYHGHGWMFRAVYKMDRKGNFLDKDGDVVAYDSPDKFEGTIPLQKDLGPNARVDMSIFSDEFLKKGRAVHLKDIHAEKGMHCVDCHYSQDNHGNGKIYAEYQAAVEVTCQDCHGTVREYASLAPTGPASHASSTGNFADKETQFDRRRFEVRTDPAVPGRREILQRSMLYPDLVWRVKQVKDTVDPASPDYNARAHRAKTMGKDGNAGATDPAALAHSDSRMTCHSCHTSWITSCFGCHLPQKANMRTPMQHFETKYLRNYASYNPQVARDDAFMLGIAGDVHGNKVSTVRSSSAVIISSEDAQRQKIYVQIPTMASNGMSSQAFNTHYAHTVRTTETRKCDDCHVSAKDDNNAWLAQTYLLGTNFVNFFGYNAWVGVGKKGFLAIRATEWDEPQAVIGSHLHQLAYPEWYQHHIDAGRELHDIEEHGAGGPGELFNFVGDKPEILSLQLRGEYLFTATGSGGFRAFDVANVGNKGFSEKIVTSPVSPIGQDTHVRTKYATAVALPTNQYVSMARDWRPENREQPYVYRGKTQNLHEIYRYAYVSDREEGLVIVDVDCLSDGNPENNFTKRAATFNPNGVLDGAVNLTVAGTTVYVCANAGVVAVGIEDPLAPRVLAIAGSPSIQRPRAVQVQFRYAFVCDAEGVKVLDVTVPEKMAPVSGAVVPLKEALDIYVARTYGYVAAGRDGMAILDLETPTKPKVERMWNAGGVLDDTRQIKVGMAYDSLFAFIADGKNGFRIAQLVSPEDTGETKRSAYGFSPRPLPKLIATHETPEPAVAVSKGLDRDRAVDESGNQIAVFGRIGGRPLRLDERQRFYLKDGKLYTVENDPPR